MPPGCCRRGRRWLPNRRPEGYVLPTRADERDRQTRPVNTLRRMRDDDLWSPAVRHPDAAADDRTEVWTEILSVSDRARRAGDGERPKPHPAASARPMAPV